MLARVRADMCRKYYQPYYKRLEYNYKGWCYMNLNKRGMTGIITFTAVLVLILGAMPLRAEKMRIAVLDLKPKRVSKMMSNAVSDLIRSEMVKSGYFTVLERGQMNEILKEQGFQQTGCTDSSCAVQIGKIVSARKILIGEINRLRNTYLITIRIVDVEKGVSEYSAKEKALGEDNLDTASEAITRKLVQNIYQQNKDYFVKPITRTGYYTRSIVPGLGQLYVGESLRGSAFMGAFIFAAGFTGYSFYKFYDAKDAYNSVPRGSPQSEFDDKYDTWQSQQKVLFLSIGITSLVYLMNWGDVLFLMNPKFTEKAALNSVSGHTFLALDSGRRSVPSEEVYMNMGASLRF